MIDCSDPKVAATILATWITRIMFDAWCRAGFHPRRIRVRVRKIITHDRAIITRGRKRECISFSPLCEETPEEGMEAVLHLDKKGKVIRIQPV